jgi:hypothetical protein
VDEFTIDLPAIIAIGFDGYGMGTTDITIKPAIPAIVFSFDMFGSSSTFLGGATNFTVNTSSAESSLGEPGIRHEVDSSTGETIGVFTYTVEMPLGEKKYCFNAVPHQGGVVIGFDH